MEAKEISKGILRAVATIVGIAALLWFLGQTSTIIGYIVMAAVLSLIGVPLVEFLENKLKFPATLAVISTISIFILVFVGIISLLIPIVVDQTHNLSLLNVDQLKENLRTIGEEFNNYLLTKSINLKDKLKSFDFLGGVKQIPDLLNGLLTSAGSFGAGLFSVLFISFFFMKDKGLLNQAVITIAPKGKEGKWQHSMKTIKHLLSRYFIGLILQITILFILYTIAFSIVGLQNAIGIAFLGAVLNLIPYIGPLIAGILVVLLTMTSFINQGFTDVILPKTIYALIGYMIAQFIDNTFSQPMIFSKSVNSHPLEIFLVILIGGTVFGITGMVVAVPAYTAIKVILKEFLSDNKIVASLTKNIDD